MVINGNINVTNGRNCLKMVRNGYEWQSLFSNEKYKNGNKSTSQSKRNGKKVV